jgi:hypothetical protein
MKFPINKCPLCGKFITFKKVAGVEVYSCHSTMDDLPEQSHYVVEKDSKLEVQHMYVFPYSIDTFADTPKSRIYKFIDDRWRLVKETGVIREDTEDKLMERLKNLLMFL